MRAAKSQSETELLLPPLRATATIVTMLAAFLVAVVLAAHVASGDWRSAPGAAAPDRAASVAAAEVPQRSVAYPYNDPATIGLY
jgi:hypothetical protein